MGMMAGILYLPLSQHVSIAGINLYAVRFLELAGFVRVMARKDFSFARLNKIDATLIALYVYTVGVFLLRSSEDQTYLVGTAVDALFSYFAFRGLIENVEDYKWFLRAFLILLVPFVALVLIESLTSNNPFSAIGGLGAGDRFRDGRIRAIGSFGHPSLMGTLGGVFLPLYIGLRFTRKDRRFATIGIALCLAIVWASNSGGPATCVGVAMSGWILWTMRTNMRLVRRGLAGALVLLAFVMKAPIWYLLARVSDLTGGDGYHRSVFLDIAFQNLGKWWLAGMRTIDTAGWLPYTNTTTGAVDMTNNFLVFGITAGLGSMILLIVLLIQGFKFIGRALAVIRFGSHPQNEIEYLYWGLGVMLGVHLSNWFGITYWDQSSLIWFLHLAIISGLTEEIIRSKPGNITVPLPGVET